MRKSITLAALAILSFAQTARAEDSLKNAIGQINNWENQAPTLGQDAGIFKKYNLNLENFGTAGAGLAGAMRAFSKGAPVRVILPAFTGTSDLYWYVKADSPIKSLKDATEKNTVAYSTSGSSSNNIVVAFVEELGLKAKPTSTGGQPGTLTSVMTGQIDIGWAAPPFGLKELNEGKIRIIARGSDVPSLRGQTVRVLIANAGSLESKKDAIARFVKGYREAVDWMYADPAAVTAYAKKIESSPDIIRQSIGEFQPKATQQTDELKDLDGAMRDAVKLKFLEAPLTADQLKVFVQIPPK